MDLNSEAAGFLNAYKQNAQPSPTWAFPTALKQIKLDGSRDSLSRIDTLLAKIQQEFAPTPAFFDRPEVDTFLRLLAYYVGEFIAKSINSSIDWYRYETATTLLGAGLPKIYWSSVIGMIKGEPLFPLTIFVEQFGDRSFQTSVTEYVENQIVTLQPPAPLEENERARQCLAAMTSGKHIPGGLTYGKEMCRMRLDYSIESLTEVQSLLDKIRSASPNYDAFCSIAAKRNFMLCCAYYYVTCIARSHQAMLKWFSYEDARDQFDENLPHRLESMTACLLGDRLYYPVHTISEALFSDKPARNLVLAAQSVVTQLPPPAIRLKKPSADRVSTLLNNGNPALHASFMGGQFASRALSTYVVQGSQCPPVVTYGPDASVMMDLSFMDRPQEAGQRMLDDNAENKPFAVMALDGYANLPTGRLDALIVDLRCYATAALPSACPMKLIINLPYRPASDPDGLAVFAPFVLNTTADGSDLDDLLDAFYLGLSSQSFPATPFGPAFTWEAYLVD